MKVSIIIPTYNRNEMLCKTLSNIISFEHQYYELIVIDQTKEHEPVTQKFLDDMVAQKKIKRMYIYLPSIPNAWNIGIKEASGDILLFFDDDIEINEYTISSHIEGFSHYDVDCITGKVIIQNTKQDGNIVLFNTGRLKKYIKSIFFFFFRKKAAYVGKLGILSDFTGNNTLPADSFIGCNVSVRKGIFEKCGLFDINYTGNSVRFETDMSVKMLRMGYKILYIPGASIIHYMDNTGGTRTNSSEAYWHDIFKNQCYFYLKYFQYSYSHIKFIQLFDIMRCKKSGFDVDLIFKHSYEKALYLNNELK